MREAQHIKRAGQRRRQARKETHADATVAQSGRPGNPYGLELILDLHECDPTTFTRESIESFCTDLCQLIDMEACELYFWDDVGVPPEEQQTDPKTKGTSAVQFILTSTIVIHTLDLLKAVYINIFSCKDFDSDEAGRFTANWFGSTDWTANVVVRR